LAEIARAPAVLRKPTVPALGLARQDEIQHGRSGDRAQNLGNPVADHVGDAHPPCDTKQPKLTAGLMWQPEIGPMA
jgi:hypothetical protein